MVDQLDAFRFRLVSTHLIDVRPPIVRMSLMLERDEEVEAMTMFYLDVEIDISNAREASENASRVYQRPDEKPHSRPTPKS